MAKILAECGSTHNGDKRRAIELVDIAADAGCHAIKYQLLTGKELKGGNIELPWEWMPELMEHGVKRGIEVYASVFNIDGIRWLKKIGCNSIKFAYSQRELLKSMAIHSFDNVYYSTDIMKGTNHLFTNLYCIPLYPVPYQVSFEGLFPLFEGFSSHTLGIEQDKRAIDMGAQYIEKHFMGKWETNCPDGKFAISPRQLGELCQYATRTEVAPEVAIGRTTEPPLEL